MQKVSIQIIKNAKRNRYKRTNEQTDTDTLETPMTFSQGNWDEVSKEKQKRISKERKQIWKPNAY